jgi:hypothetical protein
MTFVADAQPRQRGCRRHGPKQLTSCLHCVGDAHQVFVEIPGGDRVKELPPGVLTPPVVLDAPYERLHSILSTAGHSEILTRCPDGSEAAVVQTTPSTRKQCRKSIIAEAVASEARVIPE